MTAFELDNIGGQETVPHTSQSVFHAFVLYNFILFFFFPKGSGFVYPLAGPRERGTFRLLSALPTALLQLLEMQGVWEYKKRKGVRILSWEMALPLVVRVSGCSHTQHGVHWEDFQCLVLLS